MKIMRKQVVGRDEKIMPRSALALNSPFGRYKAENEQAVRTADVKVDPVLQQLATAWEVCRKKFAHTSNIHSDNEANYRYALAHLQDKSFSASEVERFSIALASLLHEFACYSKAGIFLSALINGGKDKDYVIHTAHMEMHIYHLCYENTKNVTVIGSIGDDCCEGMKSGLMTVKGNAGRDLGMSMQGGEIHVDGNVGDSCGIWLKGGRITINLDAAKNIGYHMTGGEIRVTGNAGDKCGEYLKGGEICVDGSAGDGCGDHMTAGKIRVKGSAGSRLGHSMAGGELRVSGDTGKECAAHMSNGEILVEGNAGAECGCAMEGGKILVKGDADKQLGCYMKGGTITVGGNAGAEIGYWLNGGEINIDGDIGSISSNIIHGKIYHKGKRIGDK